VVILDITQYKSPNLVQSFLRNALYPV
jgi:hypothetical protein